MIDLGRQIAGEDPLYNPLFIPLGPRMEGDSAAPKELPLMPTPYDGKILTLARGLDDLALKYTERHPEVRQTRSLLDDLRVEQVRYQGEALVEFRAQMKESVPGESVAVPTFPKPRVPYSSLTSSPVYLEMRKSLSTSQGNIATLKARVKAHEERVAELEAKVDTIPQVENRLSKMQREIQLMTSAHATMTSKRALARLGQDVEEKASSVTFRVIDPPFVPEKPSEPDKLLLNAMVLAAAIVVGVGVSFLVALISPVIIDPHALMTITGLPVLGSVSASLQPEQRRKERHEIFAFASLFICLLLVYAGMAVEQSGLLAS
jgi:hypothetical protein